jgi:glyoxylase-like metal-dependent hydrolase (beta-lactamase superfamily II)
VYRLISFFVIVLAAWASDSAEPALQIARDTYLVPGEFPDGRQPDGNSILLLAPQGVVVIDTGRHASHTQRIVEFANTRRRNVAAVINTHWHLDHIGGNALLRDVFPTVTVHASDAFAAARAGFLRDYRAQLEQAIAQASAGDDTASWRTELSLIDAGDRLGPDRVIGTTARMKIAGRPLVLHLEHHAVTAADLWIEDPATRTVFAGDLVTLPVPFFDTACPTEWSLALGRIAKQRFVSLVPGHGTPMTHQQFDVYRDAFTDLLACAAISESTQDGERRSLDGTQRAGMTCAERWIANLGALLGADDRKRVAPMIDYYLQTLLRSPARNKHC